MTSALQAAVPLKPGAADLSTTLSGGGLNLAIATSARRDLVERHLRRSTLLGHVDVLVTRDDLERGEPHPDVFWRAADLLGAPSAFCLAIEDFLNGVLPRMRQA